jgi:multicomponent K+:H+ antiporter subunit A
VSATFLQFSAPDLALTQLAVEVVTTVLLLGALAALPRRGPDESSAPRRARDALLAAGLGLGTGWVALAAMTRPLETISWYFLEHSVPLGGGANVVNVILVDFRGYDTFGELTVLVLAALGVAALATSARTGEPSHTPLLLAVAARWLLPLALLFSLFLLARGHNAPGGGFVAGLVTAVALLVQFMAGHGPRLRLRRGYLRTAAAGLGLAGTTGAGAWLFGKPFLTSAHAEPALPWIGNLPLASAMVFDVGVYLVVVGATMLILVAEDDAARS